MYSTITAAFNGSLMKVFLPLLSLPNWGVTLSSTTCFSRRLTCSSP
uniref:Uncharacterized protein n=1 Tax=Anguilla anguilla TaxID=7936 RepID=A0A0E9W6P6_ANGAN